MTCCTEASIHSSLTFIKRHRPSMCDGPQLRRELPAAHPLPPLLPHALVPWIAAFFRGSSVVRGSFQIARAGPARPSLPDCFSRCSQPLPGTVAMQLSPVCFTLGIHTDLYIWLRIEQRESFSRSGRVHSLPPREWTVEQENISAIAGFACPGSAILGSVSSRNVGWHYIGKGL